MGPCVLTDFVQTIRDELTSKGYDENENVVIFMDNCKVHDSLAAMELARSLHIHFLTYPAHCTHVMQPLDVGIFGPFKTFLKEEINLTWFNDGKFRDAEWSLAREELAICVSKAWQKAATATNIVCVLIEVAALAVT